MDIREASDKLGDACGVERKRRVDSGGVHSDWVINGKRFGIDEWDSFTINNAACRDVIRKKFKIGSSWQTAGNIWKVYTHRLDKAIVIHNDDEVEAFKQVCIVIAESL